MEKKVLAGVIILYLLAAYFRTGGTLAGYFAFTFDQGKDFLLLHKIVYQRDLTLIGPSTGIDGVFHGVWWYWFLAPWFWLLNGNPTYVVTFFGIVSATAVWIAFLLGRQIRDNSFGLICAGLVTFSQFFLSMGSQLWHPNLEPLLILILYWLVIKWLKKDISFFWIGLCLGLIFEFELAFGSIFIMAFVLSLAICKILPDLKQIIMAFGGFMILLLPRIAFDFRHGFLQTRSAIAYFMNPKPIHSQLNLLGRILDRSKTGYNALSNAYTRDQGILLALLLLVNTIILILVYTKFNRQQKLFYRLLLWTIILLLVAASIYAGALWGYYLIGLPALMLPIVSMGSYWLVKLNRKIGTLGIVVWLVYLWLPMGFSGKPWSGDAATYKNQLAVVDEIYRLAEGQEFNVSVYSPSVIDYNYQYHFLTYGQKKYGYMADRKNVLRLVFFIIEPDPWNKGYKDVWLREREGDGTIVWQKDFAGGIKVEKRIRQKLL